MDLGLKGKLALVTGAGEGVAEALAREGAQVAIAPVRNPSWKPWLRTVYPRPAATSLPFQRTCDPLKGPKVSWKPRPSGSVGSIF